MDLEERLTTALQDASRSKDMLRSKRYLKYSNNIVWGNNVSRNISKLSINTVLCEGSKNNLENDKYISKEILKGKKGNLYFDGICQKTALWAREIFKQEHQEHNHFTNWLHLRKRARQSRLESSGEDLSLCKAIPNPRGVHGTWILI